ncbi:pyruvate dehydrogenase complex dihydrolipoamide acetyltransferase [Planktotalea sp.]|uniref:pyruvate dehydrogenase complex dihydrolipoamide acetyltransferase n=1 Tax=Planktotalea sp. TaxID=2029877 RepID=UPI0025F3AE45|nr:pyruvate dehydrogenase complex dihydrolipoamide acetyltransferase [Planktotalea sp.]
MALEILMPALSPTMEEGTLAKWLVKEGDTVASGDLLAEIETDKATMEFEAVDEGVIGKLLVAAGTAAVKVNSPIAVLLEDGEELGAEIVPQATATPEPTAAKVSSAAPIEAAPIKNGTRVFASPLARRIAQDKDIDLSLITGSGPKGRIVKADIENAHGAVTASEPKASQPVAMPVQTDPNDITKLYAGRSYTEVPLDGMRKIIAARLTEAKQTIPHFYLRRDIHLDALLKFRSQINKQLEKRDVKLSVNDFIIKACALALQQVPQANAVWAGDRVLQMEASDVAVAVAIERGLFTPVLQDAETKSLSSLSSEMKDLATRARSRKLAPHEYLGGSFAISNLGMMGIDNFDAVINPPHGAILAVGAGVKKPIVTEYGNLGIATVMSVTLSVDHRVIDGALGAELLSAIKDNLENPMAMLA